MTGTWAVMIFLAGSVFGVVLRELPRALGALHREASMLGRLPGPPPKLPPSTPRRIQRAARASRLDITGLDVRDRATWPMRERMPGEPPV